MCVGGGGGMHEEYAVIDKFGENGIYMPIDSSFLVLLPADPDRYKEEATWGIEGEAGMPHI